MALVVLAGLGACAEGGRLIEPGAAGDTTDTDGDFDRAVLTVTVELSGEDSALAARLGIESGVLPDAEVRIQRQRGGDTAQTAITDEEGAVRFDELLPGPYDISVLRALSAEEVDQLGPGNSDVTGFGGGASVFVSAPTTEKDVQAVAGRRGSLVISELYVGWVQAGGNVLNYKLGEYTEVYNNADTAIDLAGKVLFKGIVWLRDFSSPRSCEEMEQWRNDPDGIWTQWIYAFPGSAPALQPGEAAVIAVDAINHQEEIDERLLDLRDADFELIGSNDVDNPSVPNMVTLGDFWDEHGLWISIIGEIRGLAEPVDVDALPQDNLPVLDPEFWRIPADKILDVFTTAPRPEEEEGLLPNCPEYVHERFDRQFARILDEDPSNSMKRRELATLPDGRVVLQRTKTSSRDFSLGSPTPGSPD